MPRMVSFITLSAILLAIAALFLRVMSSFLLPLFMAVLLVVVFRPLHLWFLGRCGSRNRLAAGLTTLAILSIVLLPMFFVLLQAGLEAKTLVGEWDSQAAAKHKLTALREKIGLELPPAEVQRRLGRIRELLQPAGEGVELKPPAERLRELTLLAHQLEDDLAKAAPEGDAEPASWVNNRDGNELRRHAQSLHQAIHALDKAPLDGADSFAAFTAAQTAFDVLQLDLLGSPLKVWLKRQANPDEEQLTALQAKSQEYADSLARGGVQYAGSVLGDLLVGLAVMVISLYYFLADGPAMIKAFMRLSPLDDRYEEQLLQEFVTVSRAVVVATLLSAAVQGLLAGVGYFFAGLGSVSLLTMLTMLFALIPFVGGTAVWLPCCVWLFVEGRTTAAIALAAYCIVFVSLSDNVIKPLVLQGQSNLHPLLALLSVFGGVKAMGPVGIVVGPMVVAFLQALLKMFQIELDALAGPQGVKSRG